MSPPLSQAVEALLPVVLTFAAAALTALGSALIRRLSRFLEASEAAVLERAWQRLVEEAVAYAEQRAKSYLKARAQGASSGQKLEWALGYISHEAPLRGLELLDAASVSRRIEACLGDPRAPGNASPPAPTGDSSRPPPAPAGTDNSLEIPITVTRES